MPTHTGSTRFTGVCNQRDSFPLPTQPVAVHWVCHWFAPFIPHITLYTMDSDRAGRRRTIEVPSKPESGLAEWTSKIKALQRQVDEDEEAEHRRLEEEITASRLARLRRSTGSRANSVDLCESRRHCKSHSLVTAPHLCIQRHPTLLPH